MPRSEHAEQCLFLLSTCLQMLQHITFKLRMSRFYLNFKCFGTSLFRTHFPDTALLLFRDFFRYVPIIAFRSSKLLICLFETLLLLLRNMTLLFQFDRNVQLAWLLIILSKSSANTWVDLKYGTDSKKVTSADIKYRCRVCE